MKKISFFAAFLLSCFITTAQENKNYDFEIIEDDFAKSWYAMGNGDHEVVLDTTTVQNGKNAIKITSKVAGDSFKAIGFNIPATFGGKKIKLTGYIKTEDVESHAGLWMRIDPGVAFDNMNSRPIKGTTDWKKYEIELTHNEEEAEKIVVGGLLSGSGTMWIDNLEITIDGKAIEKAAPKKLTIPQQDQEFDAGSNISLNALNNQELENATVLGKVWGFLKYHHPAIASGNYNWDYELFRVLTPIIHAKSAVERDKKIMAWIAKYPPVETCKKCPPTNLDAILRPDHRWMKENNIANELTNVLENIYTNRHQGKQYYLNVHPGVGNPKFDHENPYTDMTYPDSGFRLLAAYRLWNIVHYFSPNKHITDTDWNDVLAKHIPAFIAAKDELAYEIAAVQLIAEMKDTHSNLWRGSDKLRASRGEKYPPVHLTFIEEQLVVKDFYNVDMKNTSVVSVGDVITHIKGKKVSEIIEEQLPYYPASNRPSQLRDLAHNILKSNDDSVSIRVQNNTGAKEVSLPMYEGKDLNLYNWYRVPEGKSYKKIDHNIGYVTLANITNDDPSLIKKEFENAAGLIIDIRNYPSAFMPFALGSFIAPKNSEFVKFTTLNLNNPGEFTFGKTLSTGSGATPTFKGPVIIIVNELSQSQAEYTAMAFRAAPNAKVIGSTTAGADGNVSTIALPGGMSTMISGIGVYYPDGSPTQRIGIVPDIEVKPTIEGIREGRDELLEKAIALILNSQLTPIKK